MFLAEIWRYPVKSLKGERLEQATVLRDGIRGDRQIVVVDQDRQVLTARTFPRLLGLQGSMLAGSAAVNGHAWHSSEARALIEEAAGRPAKLAWMSSPQRFDILPLLVATDSVVRELGIDGRRLRPNLVIGGVSGRAERLWAGRTIRIGAVELYAAQLRRRCVMTTYDPDTQEQDRSVLFRIVADFDGRVALDCSVVTPGVVRQGDPVCIQE